MAEEDVKPTPPQTEAPETLPSNQVPDAAQPVGEPGELTRLLQERFGGEVEAFHNRHGEETVTIRRDRMLEVFRFLKEDPRCAFEFMMDLTAVDYLPQVPRFEVVYHLKSLSRHHRLRVKIRVAEDDAWVQSIFPVWGAADWYERECREMYGIEFRGHPNMKHLLLYDGFRGFPLRKDYEKGHMQPLVPLRPVRERYDYGERFDPVPGVPVNDTD